MDESRRVYVLEGQIDSMFLSNSVAVGDSHLQSYFTPNAVYIPDADVFNREIMKNVRRMIDANLRVCMLPEMNIGKDINDFILHGMTPESIKKLIDDNTYHGLSAKMHFAKWKRVEI